MSAFAFIIKDYLIKCCQDAPVFYTFCGILACILGMDLSLETRLPPRIYPSRKTRVYEALSLNLDIARMEAAFSDLKANIADYVFSRRGIHALRDS